MGVSDPVLMPVDEGYTANLELTCPRKGEEEEGLGWKGSIRRICIACLLPASHPCVAQLEVWTGLSASYWKVIHFILTFWNKYLPITADENKRLSISMSCRGPLVCVDVMSPCRPFPNSQRTWRWPLRFVGGFLTFASMAQPTLPGSTGHCVAPCLCTAPQACQPCSLPADNVSANASGYLSLRACDLEELGSRALQQSGSYELQHLDLSDNQICCINRNAFSGLNHLQHLNLSAALINVSAEQLFSALNPLANLSYLGLSDNGLTNLGPRAFIGLVSLRHVDLRNNGLDQLQPGSFASFKVSSSLVESKVSILVDLRHNALKSISNTTLAEWDAAPQLQLFLADNPFVCDCRLAAFVSWLRNGTTPKTRVRDVSKLRCTGANAHQMSLLLMRSEKLLLSGDCGVKEAMASYVLLGIVLALIGVIFLFVLYLNRKGIKRWLMHMRDACRDQIEDYNYRTCQGTPYRPPEMEVHAATKFSLNASVERAQCNYPRKQFVRHQNWTFPTMYNGWNQNYTSIRPPGMVIPFLKPGLICKLQFSYYSYDIRHSCPARI
uniref:trophoblast glycoprotein-like n=1 Tax=Myxine glutinosa TaxID=7769 RepID=UPI00358FA946